ncbi:MarR family winged helix-turn-helix transcriptional regulator [Gordonia alkanivorans]|uniref:Putative MarR family transcriptional regulator n=1 Tax=Gordonia alkanivorans NBRC 16433 TaxID=1027371 RepID=F9W0F6_9ACTN|nr:MarR family transcriptional regulator [Gordonia alkanivorans]AZZ82212.1 transcriptional regulator [Gordonia alkanivorans]GAA14345.1 putative MarR family transcriptional regulator [Gordonia alkanivorans NBRC 16433]
MSTTDDHVRSQTTTEVWFAMNSLVRDQEKQSRARISEVIDIPFSRFRALRRVAVRPMTQRDLAERMGVDASAMSGIVNDLVARGLVTREADADDGRCKRVTITDAGRRVMDEVTANPATAPEMFAALDEAQLQQLAELLDLLRAAAES